MKNIFFLFLIMPLMVVSCRKSPVAQFSVDLIEPEVGQEVHFTNHSDNASRYEWDFGDSTYSTEKNPVHEFTSTRTCNVILTAISKSGASDMSSMLITVTIPTLLDIQVLEYYQEYPIPGADVRLYPDSTSWDNEENMVSEGFTDDYGVVVFSNLKPQPYYVDVWKKNYNNYELRKEDIEWITTDTIVLHEINWFIAWVDSTSTGKGSSDRSLIISTPKRKPSDKLLKLVAVNKGIWQELYKKSIRLKY
ncbi:MAG: PKD domain-containing protein [Bacteroidales bacterium]